jgi:single-stranded DNA-binding protein
MIQVTIIGHIGNAPRHFSSKEPALTVISVASNRNSGNKGGSKEGVIWTTCNLWGERSNRYRNLLAKGQQVFVQGRGEPRCFKRSDGTPAAEIVVQVDYLQLLTPVSKRATETVVQPDETTSPNAEEATEE